MSTAERIAETAINARYGRRNLTQNGAPVTPWKALPDEAREKWTEAIAFALKEHGMGQQYAITGDKCSFRDLIDVIREEAR